MEDDEFLDLHDACAFLGGSRPMHSATFYRGIKSGIYPKPVRVAPNTSRWIKRELAAAKQRRIEERDFVPPQAAG